jgi:hypothetical protein
MSHTGVATMFADAAKLGSRRHRVVTAFLRRR